MASVARTLLQRSRQRPPRIPCRSPVKYNAQWQCPFSTSIARYADEESKDAPAEEGNSRSSEPVVKDATPNSVPAPSEPPQTRPNRRGRGIPTPKEVRAMPKDDRQAYRNAIPDHMLNALEEDGLELDEDMIKEHVRKGDQGFGYGSDPGLEADEDFEIEQDDPRKVASGFWAEGEPEMGPDEDFHGDDVTAAGHGELQKMRDLREYARLIAWELPLLSQLAKPFVPPESETPFRFRYTSYFGERHPAVNKVVVEFCPTDLGIEEAQQNKLIKLAGTRYNPESKIVKLSCEKFDTQAQNKRYLGETIESLIAEAKDPKDMFEDVPFDFRHYKPKKRWEFPKEWVLTPERKQQLEEQRQKAAMIEDDRLHTRKLIDGKTVIDTSLPFTEPVMVPASGANGLS